MKNWEPLQMTNKKTINAVIFDVDGVIFDSEMVWRKAFQETNKRLNVYVSEKFRQTCSGIPSFINEKRMQEYYPQIDASQYMKCAKEEYNKIFETTGVPFKEGFLEIIKYIKDKNLKLALCTGSNLEKLNRLFGKYNYPYRDVFDKIVTSDSISKPKPDPMPYIVACNMLEEKPENCLVIEDSINGIKSAYGAGTIPIMVIDLIKPDKITREMCEKVFNALHEIKKII